VLTDPTRVQYHSIGVFLQRTTIITAESKFQLTESQKLSMCVLILDFAIERQWFNLQFVWRPRHFRFFSMYSTAFNCTGDGGKWGEPQMGPSLGTPQMSLCSNSVRVELLFLYSVRHMDRVPSPKTFLRVPCLTSFP